ncbi:hypothetical protein L484_005812 [Morus notabilis]|uniref:Uncharacterized protein n=1 Tax=Morus notabilis TaxID=981085 RepID=W9RLL4_9ROSA|nr:hypothetical protein L484_005812 [Morus notabilis]
MKSQCLTNKDELTRMAKRNEKRVEKGDVRNKETDNTFVLANSFNPLSVNHEIISQNITCDTCINPLNILSLKPFGPELKLGEYVYDSMVNHKILTAV